MPDLPPRFPVTAADIDRVVRAFYAEIRVHPVLGPIFNGRVGTGAEDWRAHEAKIAAFWRNAILHERRYDGNPMQVHMSTPEVVGWHFDQWLALFDEVLARELPPEPAAAFSAFAHRIGRGLRMGVEDLRRSPGGVPTLG